MQTHTIKPGNKTLNLSISQEAFELLSKNVTERKRGKAIESMILKEYAPKPEEQPVAHT